MTPALRALLVSLVTLATTPAFATELVLQYAPAMFSSRGSGCYLGAGLRVTPFEALPWLRFDGLVGLRDRNALAGSPTFIFEVAPTIALAPDPFYLRFSTGIALFTRTHLPYIDTHYQFPTSVAVGLTWRGVTLGYLFKHYSNGSTGHIIPTTDPGVNIRTNRGYNFQGLEFIYHF